MGLTNRKATKMYCLEYAASKNKEATRVSSDFLDDMEASFKELLEVTIDNQNGKTIKSNKKSDSVQ